MMVILNSFTLSGVRASLDEQTEASKEFMHRERQELFTLKVKHLRILGYILTL